MQPFSKIVGRGCYRLFHNGEFVEEGALMALCEKYSLNYFTVTSAIGKYGGAYRNSKGWELKRHTQMFRIIDLVEKQTYVLDLKDTYDFFGVGHRRQSLNRYLKNERGSRYRVDITTPEIEEELEANGY